jgi:cyclophilin family peptidyl-prolyl cis-trans isomerase
MGCVHKSLKLCAVAALIGACAPLAAVAQIAPLHECAHFKRPIEISVQVPETARGVSVQLIVPATGQVLDTRQANAGNAGMIDLAELFPRLWSAETSQVLYAQAVASFGSAGGKEPDKGERLGPPIVLVPMAAPRYAPRMDRDGTPVVNPAPAPKARVLAGYWTYLDQRVEIVTSKGRLVFAMRPDAAPNSVDNFRTLVSRGFYDGIPIHRIASLSGRTLPDIVQFGDPTGTGQGGPGYYIDFEPSPIKHAYGTLSYARTSDPNSAGSQVLIALGRDGGAQLDGRYTVFGQLVSGTETLEALSKVATDADGKPRDAVTIESAKLLDAPPFGEGPKPEVSPLEKPPER